MEHSDGLQWKGAISPDLRDNIERGQLPMFMTPNEILATYKPANYDRKFNHFGTPGDPAHDCIVDGCVPETDDDMYERKLRESKRWYRRPLPEDVAEHGVQKPVELVNYRSNLTGTMKRFVGNGHHRIVSAHAVKPDTLIPVEHL